MRPVAERVYQLAPYLVGLLSFVAWQPFVRPDFDLWRADDGEYHLLRIYVFEHAFRAGEWLPRWAPELFVGYGYPIFNFYAPGTYYAALVLRALGLDIYSTAQALGALATCAGAAGAFCLTRSLTAHRGRAVRAACGLVAGIAYAYAPYPFITNLIIRADLAETLGLALLPWCALAAWSAARAPRRAGWLWLACGIAALVLTHNLTALVALPVVVAVGVTGAIGGRSPRVGLTHILAGLTLALGATAFFWLPALAEQRDVQIEVALGGGHKSPTSWLIDPIGATQQTSGARNPQTPVGPLDLHSSYPYDLNFPPKPSAAQGALAVLAVVCVLAGALGRRAGAAVAGVWLGGTALLWLLTTTWSSWAWENVPLMRFLQFSWRLYGPLSLALGVAAGVGASLVPRMLPLVALAAGLLAVNTTTARPLWLDPAVERDVGGAELVGTENTLFGAGTTTGGEFVPRAVDLAGYAERRYGNGLLERLYPEFGWVGGRVEALTGQLTVASLASAPTWTEARVQAVTPGVLGFRTLAFPGWRAYVDGREVPLTTAPRDPQLGISPGFIALEVPEGEHRVQIAFGPTRLRTGAGALSVLALGIAAWLVIRPRAGISTRQRGRQRAAVFLAPVALFALACTHDALRPAVTAPARPAGPDSRLAFDLAALASRGQAQLSSPSGTQLGPFLDVKRMRIGSRERTWLYMHPTSSASFELLLPARAALQFGLGIDPDAWLAPVGDGARFVVEATALGGAGEATPVRVLDEPLNPRAFEEQRRWHDRWIDLSAFGGRRVRLVLRTEAGATSDFDWAGWADPMIVVQRDGRRPGGGPPVPIPTPRSS